jgi:hypothetical protein
MIDYPCDECINCFNPAGCFKLIKYQSMITIQDRVETDERKLGRKIFKLTAGECDKILEK